MGEGRFAYGYRGPTLYVWAHSRRAAVKKISLSDARLSPPASRQPAFNPLGNLPMPRVIATPASLPSSNPVGDQRTGVSLLEYTTNYNWDAAYNKLERKSMKATLHLRGQRAEH